MCDESGLDLIAYNATLCNVHPHLLGIRAFFSFFFFIVPFIRLQNLFRKQIVAISMVIRKKI